MLVAPRRVVGRHEQLTEMLGVSVGGVTGVFGGFRQS